eukprot:4678784-Prymnesium_polylepis.2
MEDPGSCAAFCIADVSTPMTYFLVSRAGRPVAAGVCSLGCAALRRVGGVCGLGRQYGVSRAFGSVLRCTFEFLVIPEDHSVASRRAG